MFSAGHQVPVLTRRFTMRIRPLHASETGVLLQLWSDAGTTPSLTDAVPDLERAMSSDHLVCLVADVEGAVVGSIIAAFDGWRGNIYRLAVHPAHRRQGIARQLVDAAHQVFARWDVRRITALVEKDHAWAVAFWRAAGYSPDTKMARFVHNIPGDGDTV
jgi:ribosomal protein S18 acetylase RimI-like enzyme